MTVIFQLLWYTLNLYWPHGRMHVEMQDGYAAINNFFCTLPGTRGVSNALQKVIDDDISPLTQVDNDWVLRAVW